MGDLDRSLKMKPPVTHLLEVNQLHSPYRPGEDFPSYNQVLRLESSSDLGSFSVGDSITDGQAIKRIGVIAHINHMLSSDGTNNFRVTRIYLNPID